MTSDAVPSQGPDPVPHTDPPHTDPPRVDTPPSTAPARRNRALKTRAGYTWVALVAAAVIGVLLLIFILQNLDQVRIHLFFWQFNLPLGVTLLLSVIAGALVMALAGGWRIMQLRRAAKRR
ncbi:LapA family protein [Nocardia cerradoensis]|uniref:LapA family protein n=1 Tax=Nocardia cerradoensis TaxID=85688 RepID=UPI0002DB4C76|nr:lipopolysaccharide assembly protein LapA domain-containing protein [Nocardia cerradoensis]NKY45273.1 DUF1049 domain-containing protein [Nocardia cerradoensis]